VAACPNEVPAQARFAGVGLARPLSDEIWVVDSGQTWGVGRAFPLQWFLLDKQNSTGQDAIHIQVLGRYTDTQQTVLLVDKPMELLSADVARGLLSDDTNRTTMYSLVTTVTLERAGCLEIQAVITHPGSSATLYQSGFAVISAR
jgi:hypothetical protein